jgi:hypothetical protein
MQVGIIIFVPVNHHLIGAEIVADGTGNQIALFASVLPPCADTNPFYRVAGESDDAVEGGAAMTLFWCLLVAVCTLACWLFTKYEQRIEEWFERFDARVKGGRA